MDTIKTIEEKTFYILEHFPKSRDSDQWLTIKLWTVFHPTLIDRTDENEPKISLKNIMELEREDTISRARRDIQNVQHKFLPTSEAIAIQRGMKQEEYRQYYSSNGSLFDVLK